MHNQEMLTHIREAGIPQGPEQKKERDQVLLEELGFRMADQAEYALLAGCYNPFLEPGDMKAFRNLLDHFGINYSLLQKEYCCGCIFYRQAIIDKIEEDIKDSDPLAGEFLEENLKQIRAVGARKILFYCVGCDMVYERFRDTVSEEVLWYPTLFAQLFEGGTLELQADYYTGCHRFRRTLNSNLPDLDSVLAILNRINGLELNHLNHKLCCNNPKQLEALTAGVKNRTIITACTGCSLYLRQALADQGDYRVALLSEVMWAAINGHRL